MSSEGTPGEASEGGVIGALERARIAYEEAVEWIGSYTPYVVRSIEVVLALALLGYLAHWLYWFFTGV